MTDKAPGGEGSVEELRDMIMSEHGKGNVVMRVLPGQMMIAPLDEFIQQPADGILYDLNRSEEISMTFLKDPKWVNDFAVAKVIRKLHERLTLAESRLAAAEADARRYRFLRDFNKGGGAFDKWPRWSVAVKAGGTGHCFRGEELDRQIDAALRSAEGGSNG